MPSFKRVVQMAEALSGVVLKTVPNDGTSLPITHLTLSL